MEIAAVFLDVDGVINDHALNPGMWDRYMGEVLAPALGATPADWGRVNREVFPGIWANQHTWGNDPRVRVRREAVENISSMCRALGIEPPDEDGCCELMRSVDVHVARTAAAAYPWAADAVRALAGQMRVHMATGNPSWRVEALLDGLGVRECVGFPAGPDLVGISKYTRGFYEGIFERTGVRARQALVVDDSAECMVDARAVGSQAAHVGAEAGCRCLADHHFATLAGVATLLSTKPGLLR